MDVLDLSHDARGLLRVIESFHFAPPCHEEPSWVCESFFFYFEFFLSLLSLLMMSSGLCDSGCGDDKLLMNDTETCVGKRMSA